MSSDIEPWRKQDMVWQLDNKLSVLQDLLHSDKTRSQKTQNFDRLLLSKSPERITFLTTDVDGCVSRWTEPARSIDQLLESGFLTDQIYTFKEIKIADWNAAIKSIFWKLTQYNLISNLVITDRDVLCAGFLKWKFNLQQLRLECKLQKRHAKILHHILTEDNGTTLQTLHVRYSMLHSVDPIFFTGITNAKSLRHLIIDNDHRENPHETVVKRLSDSISQNRSLAAVTGSSWGISYSRVIRTIMKKNLLFTLHCFNYTTQLGTLPLADAEYIGQTLVDLLNYKYIVNSDLYIQIGTNSTGFFGGIESRQRALLEGINADKFMIRWLDLDCVPQGVFYQDFFDHLLQILCRRTCVRDLLVVPVDDNCANIFSNALVKYTPKLKVESLKCYGMTDLLLKDGFVESLSRNYSIQEFDFGSGEQRRGIQRKINYTLLLNRGGRRILQNPVLPTALWPYVFERSRHVCVKGDASSADIVYYLLQQGVSFLFPP